MEKIKSSFKSKIKVIVSNPIYMVFIVLVVVLYGVISAETTNTISTISTINTTNITNTTIPIVPSGLSSDSSTTTNTTIPLAPSDLSSNGSTTTNTIPLTPSGLSSDSSTTTNTVPLAPSELSLDDIVIPEHVSLSWKDNSNNEDKFNIERKLSKMMTWSYVAQLKGANITSYNDKSVTAGNTYDYRVQACLSGTGCSPYAFLYKVIVPSISVTPPSTMIIPSTTNITPPKPAATTNNTLPSAVSNVQTNEVNNDITTEVPEPETSKKDITEIINTISRPKEDKPKTLEEQTINLVYQDTNKDGISDYDSIHVYNLDPKKPSPTSTYEGKKIDASEKILLGFDPTKSELVKVEKEEPIESSASIISSYKVNEISLTEEKKIILKGQALPNSFVTLYIYSTPIMVTVKTDSNGEWQYVLDKELENGKHTVYTATVNNTGNIVAKSSGYIFTKTAEAVTLNDLPNVEAFVSAEKPGLLEGMNYYLVIAGFLAISIIVLILAGIISKKNNPN